MKTYAATALVGLILIAGCTSSQAVHAINPDKSKAAQTRRQMLFGWWIEREAILGGGSRTEIKLLCPDGKYFFDFRNKGTKKISLPSEILEEGNWGISGPVYFTIARFLYYDGNLYKNDMTQGYYYDAYRILKLSSVKFVYREYEAGDKFTAKRLLPNQLANLRREKGVLPLPQGCGTDNANGANLLKHGVGLLRNDLLGSPV